MKKHVIQNGIILLVAILIFVFTGGNLNDFNKHFDNTLATENCQANSSSTNNTTTTTTTKIISVVDGDTVEIKYNCKNEKVRLIGINTPETVDPRRPVQCFGKEASNFAKNLLTGATVTIETDPVVGTTDKYGRLLGYIIMNDGTNFNLKAIQEGYAYEYTYQSQHYKYQKEFKQAQKDAEKNQKGLWAPNTCSGKK